MGQPGPRRHVDYLVERALQDLELHSTNKSEHAYCEGRYLQNLLAPAFLTTDLQVSNVVPAGVYIHYKCKDEQNKMMPMSFDPDSNWAIEVGCDAPTFRRPRAWPKQCNNAEFCNNPPDPPASTSLIKLDSRSRFRVGEAAYYGCKQEGAVLETSADINIFELQCFGHQSWNLTWDRCVVEPTCDNLPDPEKDAPSSGLRRKDKTAHQVHGCQMATARF